MKNIKLLTLILLVEIVISVVSVMPVNMVEVQSDVSVIKLLPADWNPYQRLYDEMLAPTVRISSPSGIGSGVVIHHKPSFAKATAGRDTKDTKNTYILTAGHVVGNLSVVSATFYSYANGIISNTTITASVIITDTNKDLALLCALCPSREAGNSDFVVKTAKLAPKDYTPYLFTKVWAVGCSLGLVPRPSFGHLCALRDLCGESKYWEISAPILPGNSGGPVYDANTHEVIGIAVWVKTYYGQLITTMAGMVPIQTIYDFLDIATKTPSQSEASRQRD